MDKAVEKFGFAMGPFRMGDLAGNDVGGHLVSAATSRVGCVTRRRLTCSARWGRFGQKTGAGWYDYQAGKRDAIPSPVVNEMIEKHRASAGITPRQIGDDEIVHRWALLARQRGCMLAGGGHCPARVGCRHGLPHRVRLPAAPWRPDVLCRHTLGLYNVAQAMKRFAANPNDDAEFWQPAPLLAKLVAEGKSFS